MGSVDVRIGPGSSRVCVSVGESIVRVMVNMLTPKDTVQSGRNRSWHGSASVELATLDSRRVENFPRLGTVTRYRAIMSDGIEREVIHGRVFDAQKPKARSVELTVGTSPALSLGPEGMIMHFLLKSMEMGIDGIVFGPEGSRTDEVVHPIERRRVTQRLSFPSTAAACHQIADRLTQQEGADLSHMIWEGVSLGAIKGICFAARAADYDRKMVYSHFVAPACPEPIEAPSDVGLGLFVLGEMGAGMRAAQEIVWRDVRRNTLELHKRVARLVGPGLLMRYLKSVPRDSTFQMFTRAWRDQVATGVAGAEAGLLPHHDLMTFEIFDRDQTGSADAWREKIGAQLESGGARLVVERGRHTDAFRLSHQRRRAGLMRALLADLDSGVPVDELTHPLDAS
jgi:hypothetical protein